MMQQTQPVSLKYLANYIFSGEDWRVTAVIACTVFCIAAMWVIAIRADRLAKARVIDLDAPVECGDITEEHMSRFNGTDPFLPLYLAIKGRVYDVSKGRDFYGPGGAYAVFAGRECARALALMSTNVADCNDNLVGLTEQQLQTLAEWETKFQSKYGQVGRIVPPIKLTLTELAAHNGSDTSKPLYLAIQGIIYDVSKGRECARALAKFSTDEQDCVDKVDDLTVMERDQLENWIVRFRFKYPVVGHIVD